MNFIFGLHLYRANFLGAGLQIKLGSVVTSVDYSAPYASPGLDQNNLPRLSIVGVKGGASYAAHRVLVTNPAPLWSNITFIPALPNAKLNALNYLKMNCLNRAYIHFNNNLASFRPISLINDAFIDSNATIFMSSLQSPFLQMFSLGPYIAPNLFLLEVSGNLCRNLETESDAQVQASLKAQLLSLFSNLSTFNFSISRWSSDPYAGGAFANKMPNFLDSYFNDLNSPIVQSIYFAGDSLSANYFGTMQGAYESGMLAAQSINTGATVQLVSSAPSLVPFLCCFLFIVALL